jgi:glycine/D-amino acid oxidase-like deaminating enzyme
MTKMMPLRSQSAAKWPENLARPHVVVLGGGFGGLAAARALKHAPVKVTLVDQNNHLRADWQRQLTRRRRELGFRHVRFHGLLSDDLRTPRVVAREAGASLAAWESRRADAR